MGRLALTVDKLTLFPKNGLNSWVSYFLQHKCLHSWENSADIVLGNQGNK